MSSSDSEYDDSDAELQAAFAEGRLKPGLNVAAPAPKKHTNNVVGLKQKIEDMRLNHAWIESLVCVNAQAPLAPEMAAQLLVNEQKRENELKNNKKLPQIDPSVDPVLNDFKRETMFHRQAQATVIDSIAKLKALNLPIIRPDDYFAEMAKSDEHMQKIRAHLMQKQVAKQKSERVKQLRHQKKEGKALTIQAKLDRQKDKKKMLDEVKKVRKNRTGDLSFLDGKSKKVMERRKGRDKKFGFGGKKKGMKSNTKDSAAEISEYKRPSKSSKQFFQKRSQKAKGGPKGKKQGRRK